MKFFGRKPRDEERALEIPRGAFTYDTEGEILIGTVPTAWLERFGPVVVKALRRAFADAEKNGLPLTEIALYFAGARLIARDLRGGAIVYVLPPPTRTS